MYGYYKPYINDALVKFWSKWRCGIKFSYENSFQMYLKANNKYKLYYSNGIFKRKSNAQPARLHHFMGLLEKIWAYPRHYFVLRVAPEFEKGSIRNTKQEGVAPSPTRS